MSAVDDSSSVGVHYVVGVAADFRDALSRIGERLGLTGAFNLVTDVEAAVDRLVASSPEELPRQLQKMKALSVQIASALGHMHRARELAADGTPPRGPDELLCAWLRDGCPGTGDMQPGSRTPFTDLIADAVEAGALQAYSRKLDAT
jgi:hypothetical protein